MLDSITQAQNKSDDGARTPASTLRTAFTIWVCLLVTPFFYFMFVVWHLSDTGRTLRPAEGSDWFIACMIYLLAVVPLTFFYRTHLFRAYWKGEVVAPSKYLWGMAGIWVALELGGLLSLTACLADHALLPDLIPALIAFMFFVTFWPSGRAMTRRIGHSEDAEIYEEPR